MTDIKVPDALGLFLDAAHNGTAGPYHVETSAGRPLFYALYSDEEITQDEREAVASLIIHLIEMGGALLTELAQATGKTPDDLAAETFDA
jgi:hypothetical protein